MQDLSENDEYTHMKQTKNIISVKMNSQHLYLNIIALTEGIAIGNNT